MKTLKSFALLGLYIFFCGSSYAQYWYKGNLHTHSLWSDGYDYPEMIVDWYKTRGYNFVGLSEHNKLQEGELWKNPKSAEDKEIFNRYLSRFGPEVEYKRFEHDSIHVRLKTLEEYKGALEEPGKFFIYQSEEVTSSSNGLPVHMIATNVKYVTSGQYGKNATEIMQLTTDKLLQQRKETNQKMIIQVNHPNFGYALTADDIKPLQNTRFFEVFNGGPPTNNYGNETHDSTEVIWDKVNLHFIKNKRPLLLGVGVDDAHHYYEFDSRWHNPGRVWIMVNAPKLDRQTIIESMEAGKFYASSGVTLQELSFGKDKIALKVKKEEGVSYKILFIGIKKGNEKAEVLKVVEGTDGSYPVTRNELFVRAKIISSKLKENPFRKGDFECAWTQPVTQY